MRGAVWIVGCWTLCVDVKSKGFGMFFKRWPSKVTPPTTLFSMVARRRLACCLGIPSYIPIIMKRKCPVKASLWSHFFLHTSVNNSWIRCLTAWSWETAKSRLSHFRSKYFCRMKARTSPSDSGSGVSDVLYPQLNQIFDAMPLPPSSKAAISGPVKMLADIDLTRCPTSRLSNNNPFVSMPVSWVFHLLSYTRPEQRVQINVCKVVLTKNGLYDRWFH